MNNHPVCGALVSVPLRVLQYSFVVGLSLISPAWAGSQAAGAVETFNVVGVSIAELAQAQSQGRVTSLQLVDI